MENVNWLKLKLDKQMVNTQAARANVNANFSSGKPIADNLVQQTHNNILNQVQSQFITPRQVRMNNLASIDRAVYVKNLLNLPKNMADLFVMLQNENKAQLAKTVQQQANNAANNVNARQNVPQNQQQVQNQQNLAQNAANSLINGKQGNARINNAQQAAQQSAAALQNQQINQQKAPVQVNPQIQPPEQPQVRNENNKIREQKHPSQQQNQNHEFHENNDVQHHRQIRADKEVFNKQMNNARQNYIPSSKEMSENHPILNKGENFVRDVKQNIMQNAVNNPHNILHKGIRNQIRQPLMPKTPIMPEGENLEQIQADTQKLQGMTAEEQAKFKQQAAAQLTENVNISHISALLQKNSKAALNKMITMMAAATSQGMTDTKPLQDTVNIINSSIAATSQNDSTQTLKNLMLLYLPWLPLQEGVGFDLEVEQDDEGPKSDTYIKILITTVNYGNLHATLSLITGNSVDISIVCSEKFPKKELLKRLSKDSSQHSMQADIDIKEQKPQEQIEADNPKAKVNLSNVNQVNPYLLLMAHAIIRHTIELDATVSIGTQPIEDN